VRVKLYTEQLGYYSHEGDQRQWNVQPGKFIIKIGASSTDLRLEDQVTLVGDSIHKPLREHYFSDIIVE
jgi:beta-glucosidase